jgi:hypothetical protein
MAKAKEPATRDASDALKKLMASTGMSKAEALVKLAEPEKTVEATPPKTE